jgi:hypothetical protein
MVNNHGFLTKNHQKTTKQPKKTLLNFLLMSLRDGVCNPGLVTALMIYLWGWEIMDF